jgi:hypothetical protein
VQEVSAGRVLEATLSALGEGSAEGACHDDLEAG